MQRTRLQVFSFKWNHWLLQQPYSNSAEGAFVCQWNKTQLRKEDIWKLQFQVFIGSQVLVDCNGAVWDLMNVQCPPSKWLQMHSCNIQDHAIGVKANIDPLKSSGFFFFLLLVSNTCCTLSNNLLSVHIVSFKSTGNPATIYSHFQRKIRLEEQTLVLCSVKQDMYAITQDINVQFAKWLHLTILLLLNLTAPLHVINNVYIVCLSRKLIKYLWKYSNHEVTLF